MTSTMTKFEYVKEHFVWVTILMLGFANIFFRTIPGYTYRQTWLIWIAVFCIVCGIGIAISFKWARNCYTLTQNIICTYGVFVFIAYHDLFGEKMQYILIIALGLSFACMLIILLPKISNPTLRKRIIEKRIYRCLYCLRQNATIAFLIILLPIGINVAFTGTLLRAEPVPVVSTYDEQYSIDANMDKLVNLQEEKFSELSIGKRLELARTFCLMEAWYLGINTEINVTAAELSEGTLANYDDRTHTVCVDIDVLKGSSYDLVKSLSHEMYHSYQHRLADSYLELNEETRDLLAYREIAEYRDEMENYKHGGETTEDYIAYYTQSMEIDARDYSEWSANDLFENIAEYIEENE